MNMTPHQHHYFSDGQLQRSIVLVNGTSYRRIAKLTNRLGDPDNSPFCNDLLPIWQERIHTGEFHSILDKALEIRLEAAFVEMLLNDPANKPSRQPANT